MYRTTVGVVLILALCASALLVAQAGRYPSSRHGGNYMFNFYFPPAPSAVLICVCIS